MRDPPSLTSTLPCRVWLHPVLLRCFPQLFWAPPYPRQVQGRERKGQKQGAIWVYLPGVFLSDFLMLYRPGLCHMVIFIWETGTTIVKFYQPALLPQHNKSPVKEKRGHGDWVGNSQSLHSHSLGLCLRIMETETDHVFHISSLKFIPENSRCEDQQQKCENPGTNSL